MLFVFIHRHQYESLQFDGFYCININILKLLTLYNSSSLLSYLAVVVQVLHCIPQSAISHSDTAILQVTMHTHAFPTCLIMAALW